jgi:hypothetical protein
LVLWHQARREARALDVTGKPRTHIVPGVPKVHRQQEAEAEPNWRFHEIEGEVRRPLRTSATELLKTRGMRKQFSLAPAHIHFGRVSLGTIISKFATLSNISPDLGRYFIRPPVHPLGLKYKPGALPAGMGVRLEVLFTADTPGDFCEEIIINTEHHHFVLTVSVKVEGGGERGMEPGPPNHNAGTTRAALESAKSAKSAKSGRVSNIELDENASLDEVVAANQGNL